MKKEIVWHVEKRKVADLKPHPDNARIFTEKGMQDLKRSINSIGMAQPINITPDGVVLSGHARLMALQEKGVEEVDVYIPNRELSEKEQHEVLIRMNANIAGIFDWDKAANIFEMDDLTDWGCEIPDLEVNGEEKEVVEDEVPEQVETRCKRGDIWKLGENRLMCGDSTVITDVEKLMNGKKADMVFTDPPYGVSYEGGLNEKKKKQIKNDSLSGNDLYEMLCGAFSNIKLSTKERSAIYIFYAINTTREFINALYDAGLKQRGIIAWHKTGGGFGDFMAHYMNAYEPCIYASNGDSVNWYGSTDEKTVWDIDKEKKCDLHPTMKPIAVVSRAVKNSSKEKDGVLDLFGGSGSTLIACEQLNRKCFMMELDEHYCDVIIQRWENLTGKKAEKIN